MTNPVTKDRRHFEDLVLGEVVQLGQTQVTREMIISLVTVVCPSWMTSPSARSSKWRRSLVTGLVMHLPYTSTPFCTF